VTERPTIVGRDLPPFVPTFYPIVVAVTYFGLLFVGLGISIFSAARLLIVTALVVAVVSVVINLLMRDRNRGGVLCVVLVFVALFGSDPRIVAVGFMVGALVVVERLISFRRATRVPFRTITLVGNGVAGILVVTLVISGLQNGAWGRVVNELTYDPAVPQAASIPAERPDVYVILLDGYERPDRMPEVFGFDDGPFVSALEGRGFDVATNSRSNYLLTALSLPSLLNMRHVGQMFTAQPGGDGTYRATLRSFSADNAVFREMGSLGYETVAIASGFEEVAIREADRVVDTGELNEFELAMARETSVGRWVSAVAPSAFGDSQRSRVRQSLAAVATVAGEPHERPIFAFAHIPSPHGPIVFGPDGEPVQAPPLGHFFDDNAHDLGLAPEAFGPRYVGQVQYLNRLVIDAVDRILATSATPPVIILLSDHGSGSRLNWNDLAHSDLDERSANLLATYTPGHRDVFPDNTTLVNLFGTFLGAYFGIDVPRQPDTVYRWDDALTHLVTVPDSALGR
jgi:hypothetical protein